MAAVAVVVLTVDYGHPPWIALVIAVSFALYGLVKKQAGVGGTQSIAVETALLVVPAVAYLVVLGATGRGTFTAHGPGHAALLAAAGIATAVPLMLFGAAAIRLPLSTLGLLQYLAPVLQLLIGVAVDGERMPPSRLAGFALVWLALAVFSADAVRAARGRQRAAAMAPDPEAVPAALVRAAPPPAGRDAA